MNLNSWFEDDESVEPGDVPQSTSELGLEATLDEYVNIAEAMANDPAEDVELQDAVQAFESAMLSLESLSELGRSVVGSGSICRMVAIEARSIYPEFDGDNPLKLYSEAPTSTRLRQATEEFNKGIIALIAAISAAILALIWKTLNWVFGGKRDDKPPSNLKPKDISKIVNDSTKARDENKFDKELTAAADKVASEMASAADAADKVIKKTKATGWYVTAGDNRLEIYDSADFFEGFVRFLHFYGKTPEDFLLRSPLSISLNKNGNFHGAVAQAAKQLADIAYQILQDAKDNRKAIVTLMADDAKMTSVSKDVANQIQAEKLNDTAYTPDLGLMKITSLNQYSLMINGLRMSAMDVLSTLTAERAQIITEGGWSVKSIDQIQRLIHAATGHQPLGYANMLFEQRDTLAKLLAESSGIVEELQSLTDPSFNGANARFTLTDKTRSLVKPELARVQEIVRTLTDLSLFIQRELEDWRRDLWKAVSISERYGDYLKRLTPIRGEDGNYDQDAVDEIAKIRSKFTENTVKIMNEVNAMLADKRYQTFLRVAKTIFK